MVAFGGHCSIGAALSLAVGRAAIAPCFASKLIAELNEAGWATSYAGDSERHVVRALGSLVDQLGVAVKGRGGSRIEMIAPTSCEHAYRRSLSAEHGLKPLPLHVELSHRRRPCRYVAFGCLDPGKPSVATTILDRHTVKFSESEQALLRNAVVLVRSGRRSFYSSILPENEPFLRFDAGCMEAIDLRGREAIQMMEARLAHCSPAYHRWHTGDVLVLDNWRVLHGRASAEQSRGRRLLRVLIDG